MTVPELLARARQVLPFKVKYKLGTGGMVPEATLPVNHEGTCDCSGYVAWALGISRYQPGNPFYKTFNGGWVNTDAMAADGKSPFGFFAALEKPKPGCVIVYPSNKPKLAYGHTGIVTAMGGPAQFAGISRVIHCASGNSREGRSAVLETLPLAFYGAGKLVSYLWYAGVEG